MKKTPKECVFWLVFTHFIISISSLSLHTSDPSLRFSARSFRRGPYITDETENTHRTKRYVLPQNELSPMEVNSIESRGPVRTTETQSVGQSLQQDSTAQSIRQLEEIIAECRKTPISGTCNDIYIPHNYFADFDIPSDSDPSKKGLGENDFDAEEEAKEKRGRQLVPKRLYQPKEQNLDEAGNSLVYPIAFVDQNLISDIISDPSIEDIVFIRKDVQSADLQANLKNKCENAAKQLHILKKLQAIHNDIRQKYRKFPVPFLTPVRPDPAQNPLPVSPIKKGDTIDINQTDNSHQPVPIPDGDNLTESPEIPNIIDPSPETPVPSKIKILPFPGFPGISPVTLETTTDRTGDPTNLSTLPSDNTDSTTENPLTSGSENPTDPTGDLKSPSTMSPENTDSTTDISLTPDSTSPNDPADHPKSLPTSPTDNTDSTTDNPSKPGSESSTDPTGDPKSLPTSPTDNTDSTTDYPLTPGPENPTDPTGDPKSLPTSLTENTDSTTDNPSTPGSESPTDPTGDPKSLPTSPTDNTDSATDNPLTPGPENPTDPTGDPKSLPTSLTENTDSTTDHPSTPGSESPTDPTGVPKSLPTSPTDNTDSTADSSSTPGSESPTDPTGDPKSLPTSPTDNTDSTTDNPLTPGPENSTDPTADPKNLPTSLTENTDSTTDNPSTPGSESPTDPTGDPKSLPTSLTDNADSTTDNPLTPGPENQTDPTGDPKSLPTSPTEIGDSTDNPSTPGSESPTDSTGDPNNLPTKTDSPLTPGFASESPTDPTGDSRSFSTTTPSIDIDSTTDVTKQEASTNGPGETAQTDVPKNLNTGEPTSTDDLVPSAETTEPSVGSTVEVSTTESPHQVDDKKKFLDTDVPPVYSTSQPPKEQSEDKKLFREEISISNFTKIVYESQVNETIIDDYRNDTDTKGVIGSPINSNPGVSVSPVKSDSSEVSHVDVDKPPIYSDDLKVPDGRPEEDKLKDSLETMAGDPLIHLKDPPTDPIDPNDPLSPSNNFGKLKPDAKPAAAIKGGPGPPGSSDPRPRPDKTSPKPSVVKPSGPASPSAVNIDNLEIPHLPSGDPMNTGMPENNDDKRDVSPTNPTPPEIEGSKPSVTSDDKIPTPDVDPDSKGPKPGQNPDSNGSPKPGAKEPISIKGGPSPPGSSDPGPKPNKLAPNPDSVKPSAPESPSATSAGSPNTSSLPSGDPSNTEPDLNDDEKRELSSTDSTPFNINVKPSVGPNNNGSTPSVDLGNKKPKPYIESDKKGLKPGINKNKSGLTPGVGPGNKKGTPSILADQSGSNLDINLHSDDSNVHIGSENQDPNPGTDMEQIPGIDPGSKPGNTPGKGTVKFPELPKIDVNSLHNTPLSDLALYMSQRNNSASAALKDKIDQAFHHAEVNLPMDLGPSKTDENDENRKDLTNDPKKISQKELKSKIELAVPNAIVADGLLNTFFIILLSNNATKLNLERWTEDMPPIEVDDLCVPLYENGVVQDFLSITRLLKGTVYFKNSRSKVPIRIKKGAARKCSSLNKYDILDKKEQSSSPIRAFSDESGIFGNKPDSRSGSPPVSEAVSSGGAIGPGVLTPKEMNPRSVPASPSIGRNVAPSPLVNPGIQFANRPDPMYGVGAGSIGVPIGSSRGIQFPKDLNPRNVASSLQIDPGIQFAKRPDPRQGAVPYGGDHRYVVPNSGFDSKGRFIREPKPKINTASKPRSVKRSPGKKPDRTRIPREGPVEGVSNVVVNARLKMSPAERRALLERFFKLKRSINDELDSFIEKPVPLFDKSDFVHKNKRKR